VAGVCLHHEEVSEAVVVVEVEDIFPQQAFWEWDMLWGWETMWEKEQDLFGDMWCRSR